MALAPSEPAPTVQLNAVQGPMARHVGDLRTALAAMSGPDPRDPWWTPAPLEGPPPPAPIRVAVVTDPGGQGVHPHVAEGVRRAADALADAGYAVEELEPPALDEANDLWRRTVIEDVRRSLAPVIRPLVSKGAAAFLDVMLAAEPELDAAGYIATLAARQGVARQWTAFHAEVPLILGPVSTQPAFPIGHDIASPASSEEVLRSMRFVTPVNLLGLPAAALPVGVTEGLPMGVQIIGDRFREDLCLDAAEAIEARLGTLTPLDPA
jgi:amidase